MLISKDIAICLEDVISGTEDASSATPDDPDVNTNGPGSDNCATPKLTRRVVKRSTIAGLLFHIVSQLNCPKASSRNGKIACCYIGCLLVADFAIPLAVGRGIV